MVTFARPLDGPSVGVIFVIVGAGTYVNTSVGEVVEVPFEVLTVTSTVLADALGETAVQLVVEAQLTPAAAFVPKSTVAHGGGGGGGHRRGGPELLASRPTAAGAVLVATALSPIAPLGEARIAKTSTGLSVDPLVLSLGVLAIVLVVVALETWPAVRTARTLLPDDRGVASHRSTAVALLTQAGAPPARWSGFTTPCSAGGAGPAFQWRAPCSARCSP